MIPISIDTPFIFAIGIAFALLIIQLFFYLTTYLRIYRHNRAEAKGKLKFSTEMPSISVILSTHNQAPDLRKFLPNLLEQDYPSFEVIVINDNSTDETEEILTMLETKYTNLYHSFTPDSSRYISHKKLSLTLGIKASKFDWLVFTEPNCQPTSNQWLRKMARNFLPETDIVLGYSRYHAEKQENRGIAFDNMFGAMRYLGMALGKKTYMGFGKNLAYRKDVFFENKGYSNYLNLQRGEDDLFVNQIANRKNTRVETSSESIITIHPEHVHKSWKEEKINYSVTSPHYKGNQRFVCGLETTSALLFIVVCLSAITAFSIQYKWIYACCFAVLLTIRFTVQAIVINLTAKTLKEKHRFYLSLILQDFIRPINNLGFKIYRKMKGKNMFMRQYGSPTHIS